MSEDGTLWAAQEEGKMPQGLRFVFPCYMETKEKNGNTMGGGASDSKSKIDNEGLESEERMQLISG